MRLYTCKLCGKSHTNINLVIRCCILPEEIFEIGDIVVVKNIPIFKPALNANWIWQSKGQYGIGPPENHPYWIIENIIYRPNKNPVHYLFTKAFGYKQTMSIEFSGMRRINSREVSDEIYQESLFLNNKNFFT